MIINFVYIHTSGNEIQNKHPGMVQLQIQMQINIYFLPFNLTILFKNHPTPVITHIKIMSTVGF